MIGMIKNGENIFMKQFQSTKNKSNVFEVRNENIYLSAQKGIDFFIKSLPTKKDNFYIPRELPMKY